MEDFLNKLENYNILNYILPVKYSLVYYSFLIYLKNLPYLFYPFKIFV